MTQYFSDQYLISIIALLMFGAFMIGWSVGRKERNDIRTEFRRDLDAFIDETEHRVGRVL